MKATRNHKTILISDYQSSPTVVTDNPQFCVYHNEKYQLYCVIDRVPICYKCTKEHGKCREIIPLEEVIRDVKTSEDFLDISQSLIDTLGNIKKLREAKESNIISIKNQKEATIEQHYQLKNRVIQHFKKLEEEFKKELQNLELNSCDTVCSEVSSLQDKETGIILMLGEIETLTKYASDLQTFLRMRDLHEEITDHKGYLESMISNHKVLNIESTMDARIHNFLDTRTFFSLRIKTNQSANFDM